MFGRMIGIVALALAGSVAAANADCDARSRAVWAGSHKGIVAEATSQGATCANAVVTLVLRASTGKPLWVDSRIGAHVMIFAGVTDKGAMTHALGDWIDQRSTTLARTDNLPDWPKGANAPQAGEFPFYPESDIDQEMYLKLRGAKLPLFCYVQGMESMACVALGPDGAVTKVGVQAFPG
jgi:hypothetical protein